MKYSSKYPVLSRTLTLLLPLCLIPSRAALADVINDFSLNTKVNDAAITGIVEIDSTTGAYVYGDLVAAVRGGPYPAQTIVFAGRFSPVQFDTTGGYLNLIATSITGSNGSYLTLEFPLPTLAGFTGGYLCPTSVTPYGTCYTAGVGSALVFVNTPYIGTQVEQISGNTPLILVNTTITPEPSSFALLSTGLLGALGVAKRRFMKL